MLISTYYGLHLREHSCPQKFAPVLIKKVICWWFFKSYSNETAWILSRYPNTLTQSCLHSKEYNQRVWTSQSGGCQGKSVSRKQAEKVKRWFTAAPRHRCCQQQHKPRCTLWIGSSNSKTRTKMTMECAHIMWQCFENPPLSAKLWEHVHKNVSINCEPLIFRHTKCSEWQSHEKCQRSAHPPSCASHPNSPNLKYFATRLSH